jgi:hypothetical protein
MDRLIEVVVSGRHVFSEAEIIDAYALEHQPTNSELLEYAEMLINELDSETLIHENLMDVKANFLYDYEERA